MSSIPIEQAEGNLRTLISGLSPGQSIDITVEDQTVARISNVTQPARQSRRPGSAVGQLLIHEEDDEHLKDFAEYMP